jgi:hypothetical protein
MKHILTFENFSAEIEYLKENISLVDLKQIEKYADELFSKVGINIEFTSHFLERANDIRNGKPISVPELIGVFNRTYKTHGKKISTLGNDAEGVIQDIRSDINIPFVLHYNIKTQEFELISKTVMRKDEFKTSNTILKIS